jgi:molecular chaperone GrpE (heat shock protein)
MSIQIDLKPLRWPFFLGDLVLVVLAIFICWQSSPPMGHWEVGFVLVACMGGAVLGITPWLLEYQAVVRLAQADALRSATDQMKNLELLAVQISAATAQWQLVQEQSGKTVNAARDIADRITAEAAAFTDFLQKANEAEKSNLRLEVDKLRRVEGEWLQVIVRMLDHTYALHQAALRSRQPSLIEQLGQFQNACRDVARRIGVSPFAPAPSEPFNSQVHRLPDGEAAPQNGAKVADTIATGYTFQGQMIRPALVTLQGNGASKDIPEDEADQAPRERALL